MESGVPNLLTAILGGLIVMMNGWMAFILSGIKKDLSDMWERMYGHEHVIDCVNRECNAKITQGVVVHGEKHGRA